MTTPSGPPRPDASEAGAQVPDDSDAADAAATDAAAQPAPSYRMRRAPLYRPFILTGFGLGLVAGVILGVTGPDMAKYSTATQAGYLGVLFGLLGGVLGGVVAVLLERRPR